MNYSSPSIIDLFAGVGGFSLGATRAGFNLALSVELDRHAMAAHKLNFPQSTHLLADISQLDGEELMKSAGLKTGELAGLIGGPPCQGFSSIGKRDASDSRNDLFTKFFDLVQQCQPQFYVAENVLGILNSKYETIRSNAFDKVADDYVSLDPIRLKASDYGAPTTRERVFFIGYRADIMGTLSHENFEAHKVDTITTVSEALQGLLPNIDRNWIKEEESWRSVTALPNSYFWNRVQGHIPESVGDKESLHRYKNDRVVSGCFGTRHTYKVQKRYGDLKPGERDTVSKSVRLEIGGLCPTLRAGTGPERGSFQAVRPIHPIFPRVITPREAARLQGFPDWFRFAPTKWHSFRQIGNSVSPIIAEIVFNVISSQLKLTTPKL